MLTIRCKPGFLAILEGNATGMRCYSALHGLIMVVERVVYVHPIYGPVWRKRGDAVPCPVCSSGGTVENFLDVDLRPIDPPAQAIEGATITELVVDVPGVLHD